MADEYGGDASRLWTEAKDAADLEARIRALPGFGDMKVTGLGSTLAKRLGVEVAAAARARRTRRSATSTPRRRSRPTSRRSARTRRRSARSSPPDERRMPIELRTLTDGGQRPADVARELAAFLGAAQTSLDIAVYDVRFETDAGRTRARDAPRRAQRGVAVRLVYNLDHPGPIPVPPPPEHDRAGDRRAAHPDARDPRRSRPDAPQVRRPRRRRRLDRVDELDGRLLEPPGERDRARARLPGAGQGLHAQPRRALDSAARSSTLVASSRGPSISVDGVEVRPWFTPEYGDALSHRVAKFLGRARSRIRIASPVLSSGPILGTLVEVVNEHRCDVAGVIDETQVDEVFHQWATNGVSAWKIPLLDNILVGAPFSGKLTTPWTPESTHDFMHAKVVVADDVSFVGSFNFSRSGEQNAENVLEIHDPVIADTARGLRRRRARPLPADDAALHRGSSARVSLPRPAP